MRTDAFWSAVERRAPVDGQHRYDWTLPDAIVTALARHGLRWQPILDYSTPWDGTLAGPDRWKSAPADPTDFAAYAASFAQRYGTGGSFWSSNPSLSPLPVQVYEVWNEPNLPDFWPNVSGAADLYGDLLALTASSIRSVDPTGQVVVGGLSPAGLVEFLNEIEVRHPGLIAQMDAVAFHPYGTTFANTGQRVRVLREWLDAHGASTLPIEITETGWATPPLSESERAARMSTLVQGLARSSCGISRIVPYTWLTFESNASDPEEWFGIANANATLKPTGVALAAAIAAVVGGTAVAASDPCTGLNKVTHQGEARNEAPVPGEHKQSDGSATPEASPESLVISPASPAPLGASMVTVKNPVQSIGTTRSAAAPPRHAIAEHVIVDAQRHGNRVVIQVLCSRACRPAVRLRRFGNKLIGSSASRRLVTRYRVMLRLRRKGQGLVAVRVTVRIPGAATRMLLYNLR